MNSVSGIGPLAVLVVAEAQPRAAVVLDLDDEVGRVAVAAEQVALRRPVRRRRLPSAPVSEAIRGVASCGSSDEQRARRPPAFVVASIGTVEQRGEIEAMGQRRVAPAPAGSAAAPWRGVGLFAATPLGTAAGELQGRGSRHRAERSRRHGLAVIGEHDVAERDADLEARPFVRPRGTAGTAAHRGVPGDLGDGHGAIDRRLVEQLPGRIDSPASPREAHRPAMGAVGVLGDERGRDSRTSSNTRTSPTLQPVDMRRAAWRAWRRAAGSSPRRPRCRSDKRFSRSSSTAVVRGLEHQGAGRERVAQLADCRARSRPADSATRVSSCVPPCSVTFCPVTSKCTKARALQPSCRT